jgi:hypothetical protein
MQVIVRTDYERATAGGISSTPSFYVGDALIVGAHQMRKRRSAPAVPR